MPLIQNARVVRLNAEKFPVSATERKMLARFGVALDAIEVATPKDLISHVQDAHVVCVVSSSIPKGPRSNSEQILISDSGSRRFFS